MSTRNQYLITDIFQWPHIICHCNLNQEWILIAIKVEQLQTNHKIIIFHI